MAKCFPAPTTDKSSRIVTAFKSQKQSSVWSWICGVLCCPFFCSGLVCCMNAIHMEEILTELRNIIAFYTAPVLSQLREKVDKEQKLFLDACMTVNTMTEGKYIISNIRLIDVIRKTDTTIASWVLQPNTIASVFKVDLDNEGTTKYIIDVFTEYIRIGGNVSVIMYGLPEYLAIVMDPTCDAMLRTYKNIMCDTQMYRFICQHKERAGF